jgi:DNA topoisomerase-2
MVAEANYKHGDKSAADACAKIAADWIGNFNMFDGEGNFGWRAIPDAGAPRYTKLKVNVGNFEAWFPHRNILTYTEDEGVFCEPDTYFGLLPLALVNGCRGIATGYATTIWPRDPKRILKFVLDLLSDEEPDIRDLDIKFPDIPDYISDGVTRGSIKILTKKKIEISSLPVTYTVDMYSETLNKLIQSKVIRSYQKTISENNPPFIVSVDDSSKFADDLSKLGLVKALPRETFTFIHDNKVLQFEDIFDVLETFIPMRIDIAEQSLIKSREDLAEDVKSLERRILFIQRMIDRGLDDLSADELRSVALECGDENLARMRLTSFTDTEIDKCRGKIANINEDIKYLNTHDGLSWYKKSIQDFLNK